MRVISFNPHKHCVACCLPLALTCLPTPCRLLPIPACLAPRPLPCAPSQLYATYKDVQFSKKHMSEYLKYPPDVVNRGIEGLFQG